MQPIFCLCGLWATYWTHRNIVLESVYNVGVKLIMVGDIGRIKEGSTHVAEPVPWAVTITNNQDGVHGLVSQDIWDKTQRIISELTRMDM